jgi:hypothetical protein
VFKKLLLIYEKETGRIIGVNTSNSANLTFENMYPNATEEFKQKYGSIIVPYNSDYEKNRDWYKVENDEIIKLDSPFIQEDTRPKPVDPKDQRIADLEMAIAAILGGAI